jgi:Trypsin
MKLLKWFAAIAVVSFSTAGLCVTNGTLDNNRHPEVGTLVSEFKTPGVLDQACSGTLISPTVFLTAGHCIAIQQSLGVTQVWVTFDPVFSRTSANLYPGTMHLNQAFPGTGNSDPEDLGVVVLDSPVVGITPAALPPLGMLDRMSADGSLKNALFTIVGYGATDTVFGGGSPDANVGKGTRRYAIEGFSALNPNLMKLNMNTVFGFGGSNTGDSGGPDFLGARNNETTIIAAIVYSGDRWGTAQDDPYRLDTPEARLFLGQYVTLP